MITTAPAISPIFGNNPGFRKYEYDYRKGILMDSTEYYFQYGQSTAKQRGVWSDGISMRKQFNVTDVSPKSLKLIQEKILNEPDAYLKYSSMGNGYFDSLYKYKLCAIDSESKEDAARCYDETF